VPALLEAGHDAVALVRDADRYDAPDGAIAHLADVLDVLSDEAIVRRVAREVREREPVILPVAVLTPRLSSCWVGLVSDVPERVRRAEVGQ
jgi:nucleoside-diphosphate-sugar epimerase